MTPPLVQQTEVPSICQCLNVLLLSSAPRPFTLPFPVSPSFHPNHVSSEGEDYTGMEFQVPLLAGVNKASFSIPIVDDNIFELEEDFSLTLEIPQAAQDIGVMRGDPFMANITITSDECECLLVIVMDPNLPLPQILLNASAHFSLHSPMQ